MIIAGCGGTNVTVTGGGATSSSSSQSAAASSSGSGNSTDTGSSNSSNSQASSSTGAPAGYVLDSQCSTGTGDTGLTIYYLPPPSGATRYACVHRSGMSPYIDYDGQLEQNLANVSGGYCAFSDVDKNIGCALQQIGKKDLMNVPPAATASQSGVPAGYVLEDNCQQGTGATGKTIYYVPINVPGKPETGRNYWIECVHPKGEDGVVGRNDVTNTSSGLQLKKANPYCALSDADRNIGCALEPISKKDLMNPS